MCIFNQLFCHISSFLDFMSLYGAVSLFKDTMTGTFVLKKLFLE